MPECSYYFGYSNCTCMAGLALSWDGTNATRAVCIPKAAPVQYALILPVVLCTALALLLLGGLGWLWVKLNRERLIKASGPPGAACPSRPSCCCCLSVQLRVQLLLLLAVWCPCTRLTQSLCCRPGSAAHHGLHRRELTCSCGCCSLGCWLTHSLRAAG